jgi:RNA polymerase sigma factor (sigma-70 family)
MSAPQIFEPAGLARTDLDLRFRRPLMSFFLRRVRDRSEAEDLTQQTFLRLLGGRDRSEVENGAAFVFRIAANLLRDRHRAGVRRHADRTVSLDDALAAPQQQPVEDCTPERVLLGREALGDVLRSLDELGERTRDIFVLFRLENMRQQEIADLYGVSRSTVEKHVMKAALHLALLYGPN